MLKRSCEIIPHFASGRRRILPAVTYFFHVQCSTYGRPLFSRWGSLDICMRFISNQGSVDKDISKKKDFLNFPERTVKIYTCEKIYEKWKKDRTFLKIPSSGVYAEISYIDTLDSNEFKNSEKVKTIMCIHGIPGNYGVFSHLIKELSRNGIRVIVPTFPATLYLPGRHKTELFRHSVEEKTQLFKDFLKALKISELDGIISHSSGIYPALRLVLDPELKVKFEVLFNTGGHKKTVTMRPYWVVWICSYLYLTPMGRLFVQKTGRFIMKYILRSPIREDNLDRIMLLAITMVFSQYWKAKEQFAEIAEKKIPTLYCFSEDDKVVERKLTYEVVSLLGASEENITFYDKDGKIIKKGQELPWLSLMSFREGSHYVFRKHPEICNEEVLRFIKNSEEISDAK